MKAKSAIAILAIALGVVAVALLATLWRLRSVNLTVTRQEQQIQGQKWTRTTDCAAQADKLFSQFQDAFPEGVTLHDRESHYNAVNERCYLLFVRDRGTHSRSQRELWDAFEQRVVAHCGSVAEFPVDCRIEERGRGNVPCDQCLHYIIEQMAQ
jgi:hypothetical protein